MNRQIKFRVWNKPAKCFIQDINNEIVTFTLLTLSDYLKEYSISNIDHLIFQQYTGLNDLTGKEIYEGDYIRGQFDHGPAGLREEILPVRWSNEDGYQWNYWNLSTIEVIGNIFENPDLLKYEPGA